MESNLGHAGLIRDARGRCLDLDEHGGPMPSQASSRVRGPKVHEHGQIKAAKFIHLAWP